ncbi:hypothetical protein PYW08_005645 [Mythimna loreyi]|uniref:Uncharacterized protein n=1 Tax=Mythimna loreyi TaxID=667449 RepID=A0ACC2QJ89_9NEOP|nr:hypothetical protein PYW08_005645 [Mythimna loreyi]
MVTLSCSLPVDADKFGDFCKTVASKYVAEYGWYPMTVTMHKILIHGKDIINSSALLVGLLSEQAGEARNKFWRYDREHHSRKSDREKTMLDLFHRALESSDPEISYIRLQNRLKKLKSLPLPSKVVELLKPYEISAEDDFEAATENEIEIIEGHTDSDNITEILSADEDEE